MSNLHNIQLDGTITLLSPLSHIGESIGPDSFLSQDIIVGPDGRVTEVFVYSGNAFRGILRDLSAIYMTERLGNMKYPIEVFYLLFAGGSLGGPQSVDIDQARIYRRNVPHLSVFGGGVGNQILSGKIKVGSMYPLVAECQRTLPESLRDPNAPSWRQWTFEKSFTRMDDAKREDRRCYLAGSEMDGLLAAPKQQSLLSGPDEIPEKAKKKKEDPPQQMRYSVEMLAAGAAMYQRIDLVDMSDLELGSFVAALDQFSRNPYIGGKSGTGHGLVEVEYSWRPAGGKESSGVFARIGTDCLKLCPEAQEAKEKYDYFLRDVYDKYIDDNNSELRQLLAAGGGK